MMQAIEAHISAAARYLNPQKYSEVDCGSGKMKISKCMKIDKEAAAGTGG